MTDLPTGLWVEAHISQCQSNCIPVYVINKGGHSNCSVLLKINGLANAVDIYSQMRDVDGTLGWVHAMGDKALEESDIDAYIRRSIERDPDIWAIEIEDTEMKNPFGGKILG